MKLDLDTAEAARRAYVQKLWTPCDRDAIAKRLDLPEDLILHAPKVPDFKGNHKAFINWAHELSADEKMLAVERCEHDQLYFVDNWVWFRSSPDPGCWPPGTAPPIGIYQFKQWEPQAHDIVECSAWNIVHRVKVRQWGSTWEESADCARELNFLDEQKQAAISADKDRAADIASRVRLVIEHLPPWMREEFKGRPSTYKVQMTNGSTLKALATRDTGTLGEAYNRVLASESAIIEQKRKINLSELFESSIYESLRMMNGRFRSETTGRSRVGFVWEVAQQLHPDLGGHQSEAPEHWGDSYLSFIPANAHPLWKDPEAYERELKRARDKQKFIREHPLNILEAFSPEGVCAFDADSLEHRYNSIQNGYDKRLNIKFPEPKSVEFTEDKRWGNVIVKPSKHYTEARVYRPALDGHRYVISGDPSRGGSATKSFCAGIVTDVDTGEIPCVVHHKFRTSAEFTRYMIRVGYHYNTGLLAMETNVDRSAIKEILSQEYPNPYRRPKKQDVHALEEPTDDIGHETTSSSRQMILGTLKEEIINDWLIIYDRQVIDELYSFVTHINDTTGVEKEKAAVGANDDLVMALAIGVHIARQQPDLIPYSTERHETDGGLFLEFPTDPQRLVLPSFETNEGDDFNIAMNQDGSPFWNWPSETSDTPPTDEFPSPPPRRYS